MQSVIAWYFEENSYFFSDMICLITRDTQIIDILQCLGFKWMKVDENCTKDVSLGMIHLDYSSLLSIFFSLKYNKIKQLPNNLRHSVKSHSYRLYNIFEHSHFLIVVSRILVDNLDSWIVMDSDES